MIGFIPVVTLDPASTSSLLKDDIVLSPLKPPAEPVSPVRYSAYTKLK